jgi:putative hydrolase of the HAD superfamily
MRSLGILEFFDSVTISSESGFAKPNPGIFEAAIRSMGMPASQILLVGDSLRDDVEAGIQAGLAAVLIDRFERYPSATHVHRIGSLTEVFPLI